MSRKRCCSFRPEGSFRIFVVWLPGFHCRSLSSDIVVSDRVPIKGLGNLTFVISRAGPDSDSLPSAHTCFNHLLIPDYSSKAKLEEKLRVAIRNSKGFGLL